MVPGHIELAGYDKIRYINTMYPWEGKRVPQRSLQHGGDRSRKKECFQKQSTIR